MKRVHNDLKVWQESMELVKMIYEFSCNFPVEETYGLKSQIRRSSVSIPSNIAEGAARTGTKEFLHYLSMSRGFLSEVETQLLIAVNLGYIKNPDIIFEQIERVLASSEA